MRSLLVLLAGLGPMLPASAAHADEVDSLRKEVRSSDVNKALEAAQRLGEDTSPRSTEVILDELCLGAPPKVQAALLAGLAGRKEPHAVEVLGLYTKNRNAELRKKAVVAIGQLEDQRAVPVLLASLSDSVAEVRAAGAKALGARKEKSAQQPLVKLLVHKDASAVEPLGAIAGPEVARQLGERFGEIPNSLLVATLVALLHRADFGPEPIRVEVIKLLGKIPGDEATQALKDYIQTTDKDRARPSRVAAQKAMIERVGT